MFRLQDVSDLDVSAPKKTYTYSCSKSEIRHTNTNLNGSKHANIVHVIEIHVCYSIYPSCVEIFWCRNVLVPKRLGVFRGLVPNRLDAETSGVPGLGQKSLVTKSRKVGKSSAMSHFRLVMSALSPDGRSIWPNKTSCFCHESFRSSFSRGRVK